MSGVWVVVEHRQNELLEITLEMLGEGRKVASKLGEELGAVLLGKGVSTLCEPLAHYGADNIFLAEHDLLEHYTTDAYTTALTYLIRQWCPSVVIIGATPNGQDFASRLAARMQTGLISDCVMLKINNQGVLEMTRPSYRDRAYVTTICPNSRPIMATLRPGVVGVHKPDPMRQCEIFECALEISPEAIRTGTKGIVKADPSTSDISEAEIVVEGGLGVGKAEHWELIEKLAEAVGGSVAGSRMAMDAGWISRERLVGLTGKTISAKLVISCGISGAMQHMVGLRDVNTLVAINNDRNAPILKQADLGIVADLHTLIPLVLEELRSSRKGEEQS